MKNLILSLVLSFATILAIEAQFVAGGTLAFNFSGSETVYPDHTNEGNKYRYFELEPKAGYLLNENLLVGLTIGFTRDVVKTPGDPETVNSESGFNFTPFGRYYALRFGKFAVFAEASAGIYIEKSKTETGNVEVDGPKTTGMGFTVKPGISFQLTDRIDLEAYVNGISIIGYTETEKSEVAGTTIKDKSSYFGVGASSDNLVNTNSISIGMLFSF